MATTPIEERLASLLDELRVPTDAVPGEIAETMAYVMTCDALLDTGTPEDQLPSVDEWRTSRG